MEELKKILSKFPERNIAVFGDVMLDKFIEGSVERISPEAPVPVLRVKKDEGVAGGAANVAVNLSSLEARVSLFGLIGDDLAGKELSEIIEKKKVDFFPSFSEKTTEKTRIVSGSQQLLRFDREIISPTGIRHSLISKIIQESDCIIVSDYAKGAIDLELISELKSSGKKIFVDPKPKNMSLYEGVYLVKMNEKEAIKTTNNENVYEAGKMLQSKLKSKIIITRGKEGSLLFDDKITEFPAQAREVYDVTGAGDTFIATLAMAISSGANIYDANLLANYASGIVVEKFGTATTRRKELESRILHEETKIKNMAELKEIVNNLRNDKKTIVWTNGCFDLIHGGHTRYLKRAKEEGDILVVGLNSDSSVKRLKGLDRPINNQFERAEVISSLACVDYVLIFEEDSPAKIIGDLKPSVFVKGGDYTLEKLNPLERSIVESYNGRIAFIPIELDSSTTKMINKIQKNPDNNK